MKILPSFSDFPHIGYAFSNLSNGNQSYTWGEPKEVLSARKNFLKTFNFEPEDCIGMRLDHNLGIEKVTESERGRDMLPNNITGPLLDALITNTPNLPLFMLTGDCLPAIVYDPIHQALGVMHLSWKTIQNGLVRQTINHLTDNFASQPADLRIGIGPAIHKESYAFDAPEQEHIPEWQPFLTRDNQGLIHIDLIGLVLDQLASVGVRSDHIEVSSIDTGSDTDFFSHYRSRRTGEPEGRFATVAWLLP